MKLPKEKKKDATNLFPKVNLKDSNLVHQIFRVCINSDNRWVILIPWTKLNKCRTASRTIYYNSKNQNKKTQTRTRPNSIKGFKPLKTWQTFRCFSNKLNEFFSSTFPALDFHSSINEHKVSNSIQEQMKQNDEKSLREPFKARKPIKVIALHLASAL